MLTDTQLLSRIIVARRDKGYPIATGEGEINTDYIEGMDLDGTPNENRKNAFDDLHVVWTYQGREPILLMKAECTTQPGARYTLRPINAEGAAIIDLGYQECWQPGLHRGQYPALIQTGGAVRVWRDRAKSYMRGQGQFAVGWYGINQHHGYDAPRSDIGSHSAGCLVTRSITDHQTAMSFKKQDPRYLANRKFVFGACVMTAAWITGVGDHDARPRPEIRPDVPKGTVKGVGGFVGLMTALGAFMADHWPWFLFGAVVVLGVTIGYYWREPYAPKQGDIPHD